MTIKNPSLAEQRELLQTIKFPPRLYKIEISGRGGEIVIGSVSREAYDYLEEYEIDINDMIEDEDNELEIPEEYLFIENGLWEECDNIAHENGATMDDLSIITVYDEKGNSVWSGNLSLDYLYKNDIDYDEIAEIYVHERDDIEVAFIGQSTEKGLFFGGEFTLKDEFDPTKLKIEYSDIDGWSIFSSIQYDGEYVDNVEYETDNKGVYFDLILNTEDE